MGLDMYIDRVSRPTIDDTRIYEREELDGIVLKQEDLSTEMYTQLAPYCVQLQVLNKYYDMENIRKDYGLSDKSYICGWSSVGIRLYDPTRDELRVTIPMQKVDEKYTLSKVEMCYFTKIEEVAYWRKKYDLQDWFHDNIRSNVENMGYYLLDEDLLENFKAAYPNEAVQIEVPNKTSALFYLEWY